jgi:hypothetical protein
MYCMWGRKVNIFYSILHAGMPEKVNPASVNCLSPASAFRHRGQSGTAGHGIVRHGIAQLWKDVISILIGRYLVPKVFGTLIGWKPSGFGARMNKFPTCLFIGIKTYLNFLIFYQSKLFVGEQVELNLYGLF